MISLDANLKELQSKPNRPRRWLQVLIEITPSQRILFAAKLVLASACSRFQADEIDRGHVRTWAWICRREKVISAAA